MSKLNKDYLRYKFSLLCPGKYKKNYRIGSCFMELSSASGTGGHYMKKIRWFLFAAIGMAGFIWCMVSLVLEEDNYVYYEWNKLSEEEVTLVGDSLGIQFPDDFIISRLTTHQTFVPDMGQNVNLYYISGNAQELAGLVTTEKIGAKIRTENNKAGNYMSISWFGDACRLHHLVKEHGTEHREKLIARAGGRLLSVLLVMVMCILPYKGIYKKMGGL